MHPVLAAWRRCQALPFGKAAFSRAVCWKAPYFGSIRPKFMELAPGSARVAMGKRRAVTNHIGTVHAIAMCNLAELAAGTMTEVSIPRGMRWIPRGMQVDYLRKATTDVEAIAVMAGIQEGIAADVPVTVDVRDTAGELVCRAVITMWVSPRRAPVNQETP
jgi:acyl-coenzyme A thioesterase PaaI-like protein